VSPGTGVCGESGEGRRGDDGDQRLRGVCHHVAREQGHHRHPHRHGERRVGGLPLVGLGYGICMMCCHFLPQGFYYLFRSFNLNSIFGFNNTSFL